MTRCMGLTVKVISFKMIKINDLEISGTIDTYIFVNLTLLGT